MVVINEKAHLACGCTYTNTQHNKYLKILIYLHKACGKDDMIGPYPWALSYNSNRGAATSL